MKKVLRIILIILILMWMSMVFGFSASDGDESSSLSTQIANIFSNDEEIIEIIEPIIRKIAHLSEYALGGMLFLGLFLTFNLSLKKQCIFSGIISIIYAITDEVHQLFIPGRSGRWQDVCIDTIGAFIGICVLLIIIEIIKIIKNKKMANIVKN